MSADPYAAIRFSDRPIAEPLPDPGTYVLAPGAITADCERKPAHSLRDLYPNIADFRTYPVDAYRSRDAMAAEWSRLWPKVWLLAGPASDVPSVGDFFRFDLGDQSIIIVRSATDRVQAFHNVCKHRGNQLVRDDFGRHAKSFTCIVHSWCWNLKGRNVRVTDRETFRPEALCGSLDLAEVTVKQWGGLIFITLNSNPMPFEEYYGGLLPTLASYRIDELFVIKDLTIEVAANWKTMYTVFNESYHAHATHPQIKPAVEDYYIQADFYPNGHNRHLFPVGQISHRWPDRVGINDGLAHLLREAGIDPATFTGTAADVRRAIQRAKRQPDNAYGIDYSGWTDNQLTDDWNPALFPNVTLNMHPEGVLLMRFRPHASDPERGYYDVMVLARKLGKGMRPPAYMGVDDHADISGKTRPSRIRATMDNPQAGELLEQDFANFVSLQRGMRSLGLGGIMRYSEQEQRIQQFHAELDLYLSGKKG